MAAPAIRLASSRDLEAIVAIYNATIPTRASTADLEPVSVASRRSWLARHDPAQRPCWVLEQDGEVAGWLSLESYKDRAAYSITAEVSVYVDERRRRRGHARALLEHAQERAPGLGLERLLAVVFGHNAASVALFERAGFERWGLLPGVTRLDGRAADIVILGWAVRCAPAR
ncbi:MAG TPA: GNAT family N-acetyltransferase [Solirubrobacteraceae bacterium]|nr:GNAT family N-acetyltransferase [Solirubrobacteraceae bacterium]